MTSVSASRGIVRPFVPKRGLTNGHVMTIVAWARSREFPDLPVPEPRLFRVSTDTEVLAHCYWQPERSARRTVVVLHGLEGSSSVHYMRGVADKAYRRGWNAVLLNQRNCGGTEHLTPGLYHSGLTADPRAVIASLAATEGLTRVGVVGYSLGGNLAVRIAGEVGDEAGPIEAAAAVCPTIDLERCVQAIERRANIPYHFNFVRNLRGRMRRKSASWPEAFDLSPLGRIWTIRKFDDVYTAPHHGFGDARNYYYQASAMRVVDRIRIPTLILAAEDDPFVPASQFREAAIRNNPSITVSLSRHGGHCGFIEQPAAGHDGYWAEEMAMTFLDAVMPASPPAR
jgi:predicted alpha/beta-fold hydrolase